MSEVTTRIASAYAFSGTALRLGAVVHDGVCDPAAQVRIPLAMLNRHGLIAGATGTGKTKTLQLLAEQLSEQGVAVFAADVKGDLSGLATAGEASEKVTMRSADTGDAWAPTAYPTEFFVLGGAPGGIPLRATMTSFGPILLSRVLGLNETQESALGLMFHWADRAGLPLLDLKDLRSVITYLTGDEGKAELKGLGGVSSATAGVILRELVELQNSGADAFFGEPELDTADLLRTASDGRGVINCLELAGVQRQTRLFSTFLMWLLADLFDGLPEIGDADRPKLVFFLDEAHLLFSDASPAFLDAIVTTVRLIRSKGVGVFFVTQNPTDLPSDVLAPLGNRIQHALRAFTPDDADALRKTVRTYPTTEDYDLEEVLTSLGTGEAIVTVMSDRGAPTPVAWSRLPAPRSLMAPSADAVREAAIAGSPLHGKYSEPVDRDSAYERLAARIAAPSPAERTAPPFDRPRERTSSRRTPKPEPTVVEQILDSGAVRSFLRSAGTALGRSMFGTRRRG
ncbi:DUF853 family protein [soil metagenome]